MMPAGSAAERARRSTIAEAYEGDLAFDAGGVRIRYVDEGAGEPVVLVHSYTSDLDSMWRDSGVLAALARTHRALALDLRGHGRSDKPHHASAYGPEMAWDIVRLLDHLSLARAHVVGYSLGGHVLAQLLTLAPERLASATLGGASGRRHWSAHDDRRVELEAAQMEQGRLDAQLLRLWPTDRPLPVEARSRAHLDRIASDLLRGKDPLALAAVRRSNRAQAFDTAALAAVQVPVLGVVGSADPYRRHLAELVGVLPDYELVIIEGGTHGDTHAQPAFLAALMRFLGAHPMQA